MAIELLVGHTSEETAHETEDYPYGYVLRCYRREWLEHNPKHGYRFVTMTSNPKRIGLHWNKPKASTYATLGVMFLDDEGHVQWDGISTGAGDADIDAFETRYSAALQGTREQAILAMMRAMNRTIARIRAEQHAVAHEER